MFLARSIAPHRRASTVDRPVYKYAHAIFMELTSRARSRARANRVQVDIQLELIQLERGVSVWARLDVQVAD